MGAPPLAPPVHSWTCCVVTCGVWGATRELPSIVCLRLCPQILNRWVLSHIKKGCRLAASASRLCPSGVVMLCDYNATQVYRRLFGRYPTGVAVCLAGQASEPVGMTVNSLSSVSLEPLLLSFCAARGSRTAQAINNAGCFSVNLLTHRQEDISRHFAGKPSSGALDQLLW